jgi:WhiB family redox-sensing transcriptional regulator
MMTGDEYDAPPLDVNAPNWAFGACKGLDTQSFFSDDRITRRVAAMVCARCPIKTGCGEWAVANRQVGMWGGRWLYDGLYLPGVMDKWKDKELSILAQYNAAIMAVSCVTCHVPAGSRCRPANGSAAGIRPVGPHKKRRDAAAKVAQPASA